MMMHDYKRALYDFSAAILNQQRHEGKQQFHGLVHDKNETPGLALFYLFGGQCNFYLGQYEEALAHYEIALKHDRDDANKKDIYYNKGLANASLMRY